MTIIKRTTVGRREVLYEVLLEDETAPELVWSKTVEFGARDTAVAGGAAFRFAAREQEDVARSYQTGAVGPEASR